MSLYIVFAILLASANAKFYRDCGTKLATVENVGVSGCKDSATQCVLRRNTNATISIEFTPTQELKAVEAVVHGILMNLPVPFPLPQPDACKDSGLTCPLAANQKVKYVTSLPILKSYPQITVDVKWELLTDDDEEVLCVIIPAKIH
uniref:Niemann Pick type C n=1 Tax=Histia rhodope TaxID=1453155 RepID=A0A6M3YER9_9NEOP|nr:Niemann Pick type C [Histia rhodope]